MPDLELTLGEPAAGGGFVARDDEGRVVFVRHGLSGERVRAVVTEEHATWARADVTEVLESSPHRVEPPCPYAGPGRCGGCDYQHIEVSEQRRIKQALLAAQLRSVAGIDHEVIVEPAVPDGDGLATRTRVRYGVSDDGDLSMRVHRRHDLVEVASCALGVLELTSVATSERGWPPGEEVELVCLTEDAAPTAIARVEHGIEGQGRRHDERTLEGPRFAPRQAVEVRGRRFHVSAGVFWQVHVRAAEVLVDAALEGLDLSAGDRVLDLYCGAGLFTATTAAVVGASGSVTGIDSSRAATSDAKRNVSSLPWVSIVTSRVDRRAVERNAPNRTHVVMDPPRRGADRGALQALSEERSLRKVVSVSCAPATFARDLKVLCDAGWRVTSVRAWDLFEMTEHLECIAVLER